jgi:BlaI family transcriptional regulator, penicillinase repressor
MPNLPQISDAEWDVMKVVWDHGPLTAGEVVRHLAGEHRWSPRTVKTLLNRLVRKGALGFRAEGNRYHYHPKITRDAVVRTESRSFLSRVFGGAAGPMLAHFVNEAPLTPDEIRQLRELLERRERKGK